MDRLNGDEQIARRLDFQICEKLCAGSATEFEAFEGRCGGLTRARIVRLKLSKQSSLERGVVGVGAAGECSEKRQLLCFRCRLFGKLQQ